MHLRTIYPILLLLAGSVAILPAATVAPEKEPVRPLQPVLIELLDQERGNWIFMPNSEAGASLREKSGKTVGKPSM